MKKQESKFHEVIHKKCKGTFKLVTLDKENKLIIVYNGIDRKNNFKGYTKSNCVTCCAICNRAKYNLSEEDYKKWITNLIKNYA